MTCHAGFPENFREISSYAILLIPGLVETYTYIYFGDIDMDGAVGSSDAAIADYYEVYYEGYDTLYQFMAGDIDGDAFPGSADAATMDYWEVYYEGMPTQADIAAVASGNIYEIF